MVRISGIVKTAERVKSQLQHGINPQEVDSLKAFVIKSLHTIDRICTEANTTPDRLSIRSRKAYYYLKNVELVLYHELLHKHHGAKLLNGKRMVHTPEFRRSERQFRHYQEAQQWLERSLVLTM